jgi:hypothetical protein
MKVASTDLKRYFVFLLAAAMLQLGLAVWQTSRFATFDVSFVVQMLEFGIFLLGAVALPLGVILFALSAPLRSSGLRRAAGYLIVLPLFYVVSMILAEPVEAHLRNRQLRAVAARGNEVVSAISVYQRAHGKPPASLQDLVPQYIPSVPATGMATFPAFRYMPSDGGEWTLMTPVFVRGASYAYLEYRPSQRYEPTVERIDGWAFTVNS